MDIEKRIEIHQKCYINNVWFYHKTNLVRAPLEALITIYLLEFAMMFSDWFVGRQELSAPKILLMVFIPLILASVVCLVYSGGVILYVNRNITRLIKMFEGAKKRNMVEIYTKIEKEASNFFFVVHLTGTLCYLGSSTILYFVIKASIFGGGNLNNFIIIVMYGFLMGLAWNVYGYYSDKRIDWSKIYKDMNLNISDEVKIKSEKYKSYNRSVRLQITLLAIITLILVLIFKRFDYSIIPQDQSFNILVTYSAFGAWFIAILKIYCTQMFNMFFRRKYKESEIFPKESEILLGD